MTNISKNTKVPQCDKTAVMQSVIATDLRIGNLYEYFISDKNDDRKEWWEVVVCDTQDLVYLEKNPNDRDFRSLLLTEQWLINFGFKETKEDKKVKWFTKDRFDIVLGEDNFIVFDHLVLKHIKYVHQLQNLYFSLTNRELTVA